MTSRKPHRMSEYERAKVKGLLSLSADELSAHVRRAVYSDATYGTHAPVDEYEVTVRPYVTRSRTFAARTAEIAIYLLEEISAKAMMSESTDEDRRAAVRLSDIVRHSYEKAPSKHRRARLREPLGRLAVQWTPEGQPDIVRRSGKLMLATYTILAEEGDSPRFFEVLWKGEDPFFWTYGFRGLGKTAPHKALEELPTVISRLPKEEGGWAPSAAVGGLYRDVKGTGNFGRFADALSGLDDATLEKLLPWEEELKSVKERIQRAD